jgi:hypothetical protein
LAPTKKELISAFESAGLDYAGFGSWLQTQQTRVAASGLSADEQRALANMGFNDKEIQAIEAAFSDYPADLLLDGLAPLETLKAQNLERAAMLQDLATAWTPTSPPLSPSRSI